MGRPKGSTNKEKEVIENVPQDVLRGTICECGDTKELHYGGEKGHCHQSKCLCQEFK